MPTILTPISLWKDFDDSLPLMESTADVVVRDGVVYERVRFLGRDTGEGRVVIAGIFARAECNPSDDGVLVVPDSRQAPDEELLAMFVRGGYSALMVDIRGEWESGGECTVYPANVQYANYARSGRNLDFVDESADRTSWYEWVAVGLYARRFLAERLGGEKIGVVGIRDGGEVVWKLAYAGDFACAVPVCAVGWRAYKGYNKFGGGEPSFDEERHRFIAAVDSQAYAPYVRCPVLMLCSTNDEEFDYDRAYDTFSRINPQYINDSVIAYSVKSNACIAQKSVKDMFMFLDKHVKDRQVFISKPAEISVCVDENSNLVGKVVLDGAGEVEQVGMYMAEDCVNPALRDWMRARPAGAGDDVCDFYLDVYEKTSILFLICYVTYTNGFTVWSKITAKKLSGTFRNSRPKCNVLYSVVNGADCFSIADVASHSVARTFFADESCFPRVIDGAEGLKGLYSPCGLSTYRLNSCRFSPRADSILKLDVYAAEDCVMELVMTGVDDGEQYVLHTALTGGVWQGIVLESKLFKSAAGKTLAGFDVGLAFTLRCPSVFAVNNVMWL